MLIFPKQSWHLISIPGLNSSPTYRLQKKSSKMLLSGSFVKVVVCPGFVLCDFSMTINVEMNYPLIGGGAIHERCRR